MVQVDHLFRSMTSEPDEADAQELRPVPLSESPFISDVPSLLPSGMMTRSASPNPTGSRSTVKLEEDGAKARPRGLSPEDEHAQTERDQRKPPEWLVSGIFFDLAWTTTFSSLTSNTPITTMGTVLSYAVFFTLAWWLWAAQVAYDSKFYTNDWFHRIMLLAQLAVFGAMSAFTKDFDPFSTHVNPKASAYADFQKDQYTREAMLGISGLFSASRVLLAISYARVLYYSRKSSGMRGQRRSLYMQIGTCLASAALYGIAALIVKYDLHASSVGSRLFLWFLATVVEVASFMWTADLPASLLVNDDYVSVMGERVRTLTTIILGEGVNGVASVLVLAASAIGFGSYAGGSTAATSVVIAFAFLLYFDGWRPSSRSGHRTKLDFLLHFPLHLALIVLLEALKNSLAIASATSTLLDFTTRASTPQAGESAWNALEAAFKHLGIDLNATFATEVQQTTGLWHVPEDQATTVTVNKLFARVFLTVLEQYQVADDVKQNFTAYLDDPAAGAVTDNVETDSLNYKPLVLVTQVLKDQLDPSLWIPIAAGVFLGTMSVLALVNAWIPKHRYVWASALSRLGMAFAVSLLALIKTDPATWAKVSGEDAAMWGTFLVPVLPLVIMGAFIGQYFLDQLIFYIASRRRDSRRAATRA